MSILICHALLLIDHVIFREDSHELVWKAVGVDRKVSKSRLVTIVTYNILIDTSHNRVVMIQLLRVQEGYRFHKKVIVLG